MYTMLKGSDIKMHVAAVFMLDELCLSHAFFKLVHFVSRLTGAQFLHSEEE